MNKIRKIRLPVELQQLQKTTKNHGITCATNPANSDDYSQLLAIIPGPKSSPYDLGKFQVLITVGDQYPFRPPTFKFQTPVYHPNIDNSGNICLDLLKMPPSGTYNPAITLESILLSIQLLLATPNPEDPLRGDAADLYKSNREAFCIRAREEVRKQNMGVDTVRDEVLQTQNDAIHNCTERGSEEVPTRKKLKLSG